MMGRRYSGTHFCHLLKIDHFLASTSSFTNIKSQPPGYRIPHIVQYFLYPLYSNLLRIVCEVNRFRWDINHDGIHTCQFPKLPFNGMLAMLTRNVWCYKGRRFHDIISFLYYMVILLLISCNGIELD